MERRGIMKRVLSGVFLILLLISIIGCRDKKKDDTVDSAQDSKQETDSKQGLASDFDENGNLNLFPTKDRPVIKTDFGYYIFKFDENRLAHLTVVYNKETPEAAQEMYDSMSSPGFIQEDFQQIVLNGQYIACSAKEDSERYGYLFKMSKLDILNNFYNKKDAES